MYSLYSPSFMSIYFVVFNLKFNSDFSRLRPDVTNRTVRNRTLSNLIERLDSISSIIEPKNFSASSIAVDFRTPLPESVEMSTGQGLIVENSLGSLALNPGGGAGLNLCLVLGPVYKQVGYPFCQGNPSKRVKR